MARWLDGIPVPVLVARADGAVLGANGRCGDLFAASPDGVRRTGLAALFPAEDEVAARIGASLAIDAPLRLEGRRLNGVPFALDVDTAAWDDGTALLVLREISDRDVIAVSHRLLDAAFAHAPIGMALFNTNGQYLRVNAALSAMLERPEDELLGRRDEEFTHVDDRQADVDAAWRVLRGDLDAWQTEKRFVRPDGTVVWVIANLAFVRDGGGRPLCWLGQFQDITERKGAELRLRHQAEHDELTGVGNRRRLVRELTARMAHADRHGERGAVLVLDLDGFKGVNDSHGHAVGDRVLTDVAALLAARLRRSDLLARLGGDEFAAVLPHVECGEAISVGLDLIDAVRHAAPGFLGASCGVALYGPDALREPEEILVQADRAMYEAKAAGSGEIRLAEVAAAP